MGMGKKIWDGIFDYAGIVSEMEVTGITKLRGRERKRR